MAKTRVYELARELKIESKALIGRLKELGIEVASHQSTLTEDQISKVKGKSSSSAKSASTVKANGSASTTKSASKPKVIRRRRKVEAEPEAELEASAEPVTANPIESLPQAAMPATSEPVKAEEPVKEVQSPSSEVDEEDTKVSAAPKAAAEALDKKTTKREPTAPASTQKSAPSFSATIVRRAEPSEQPPRATSPGSGSIRSRFSTPSSDVSGQAGEGIGGLGQNRLAKKKPTTAAEFEEELKAKPVQPKQKRAHINVRSILEQTTEEDELDEFRKRRTVYTPSASRKSRDMRKRKGLKQTQVTTPRAQYRIVKVEDTITVGELAKQLSIKSAEVIKKLMEQGVMATINQSLDMDTATLIATDYGYEVENVSRTIDHILAKSRAEKDNYPKEPRPPIVTVMGHVDHGKTSILDAIRSADVASREAGGITQHIGAYSIVKNGKSIAFLDTPGHEAFSNMRSRGAQLTDIVVLVVAADDGVMPQTIEAISHAKDAGVPIIVAINKIDKPNKNLDRVYTELSEHGVQAEEWGGDIQFIKCSALENKGIDELLEAINLQAEILELQTTSESSAEGVVVEAHLDKGRGPVATIMVKAGTLKIGDNVVVGTTYGKVRAMQNHLGKKQIQAGPSMPVEVIGLADVPKAGDEVDAVEDEKTAKEAAEWRAAKLREEETRRSSAASLSDLLAKVKTAEVPQVPVVIKGDTQGSVEAIVDAISKIKTEKVTVRYVHKGVGGVTESEIALAATSGAIIIAFNVRASRSSEEAAEKQGVPLKYFSVIYDLVDAVKAVMAGSLPPIQSEVIQGHAEVRTPISVPKIGLVAGSAVTDGKITRSCQLRLIRDNVVVYDGKLGGLRRFKEDVKEVMSGYECGISFEGYNDVRQGDVIEAYTIEESQATL